MAKRPKFTPPPNSDYLSALLLIVPRWTLAQSNPPPTVVRDPNAIALVSKSLQALAGGTTLTDITLQASANYTAGSDVEAGPATLVALGNQMSSVTLNLTNGQRRTVRYGTIGAWVGPDGTAHLSAGQNCLVDASWFYPAFTLVALATDPTLSISLVGQEIRNGESVYHLSLYRVIAASDPITVAEVQHVSTMHLYLDSTTLLPADFDFTLHPEQNAGVDLPFEIRYSGYQTFGGVQVPTAIQRYVQNSLTLSLSVASAAANSGVPASFFALPTTLAGGTQ